MRAEAIVAVKIVNDKAVHSLTDAETHPCLQHGAPIGIVEARPILAHAADTVSLIRDRLSKAVFLQQIDGVSDRFRSEDFLIPLRVIKTKETTRSFGTFGVAHKKFHIHVADDF